MFAALSNRRLSVAAEGDDPAWVVQRAALLPPISGGYRARAADPAVGCHLRAAISDAPADGLHRCDSGSSGQRAAHSVPAGRRRSCPAEKDRPELLSGRDHSGQRLCIYSRCAGFFRSVQYPVATGGTGILPDGVSGRGIDSGVVTGSA